MFVNRLDPDLNGMSYNEKQDLASPISVPPRRRNNAADQPTLLVDLFEPSSPTHPHRRESAPRRRSWVSDSLVPACLGNSCIDELIEEEQALPVPSDRCGIGLALQYRKVAAVVSGTDDWSRSSTPTHTPSADDNLLRFDEDIVVGPSPAQMSTPSPLPYVPMVSPNSTPSNEGVFARIAAAALSLPARFRSTTKPNEAAFADATLDTCPVCSLSFRKWDSNRMQEHVDQCISKTERSGSVQGNRFSTHRWARDSEHKECSICFEDFEKDQSIAVLNCLCQFHQKCITAWFERGKCCPFHAG